MEQADLELQLKVWKELAISKQVLMRNAAEALKLDPDCTQEELKAALEGVTKKVAQAEAAVVDAQQKARLSLGAMEQRLNASVLALNAAEATVAELRASQDNYTKSMAIERASVAQELQKLKERVAEKDKALKAINTALADTPENVLKKMNALKKQKQEEADARRQVEASLATLRKEKQQQDKQLATLTENTAKLVTQYRELHAAGATLHDQLKPLAADAPALPELNADLLLSIEDPEAAAKAVEAKSKADGKSKPDHKKK